jgi:membrane protein required for colicin V production
MSLLPDDPENTILKRFKKKGADEEQTNAIPDAQPTGAIGSGDGGYSKSSRDGLKQLLDGKAAVR